MSATSQDLQKITGHRAVLTVLAIVVVAFGIGVYINAKPSPPADQDACIAAHAADYGITTQQLTRDVSHQSELLAALSSCNGMAP